MKQPLTNFLEFKGKTLLFLAKNATYWIALKPVCEALGVNYNRQFQNINNDLILGPAFAVQQIQVPGDQVRKFVCLPERYIYGWIFSIQSASPELLEYKKQCYEVLYEYFHGTITSRRELLKEKARLELERSAKEIKLLDNKEFIEWQQLKAEEARLGIALKRNDQDTVSEQKELFDSNL
ncbi:MAG TPA: phage antirepressor N-terminal domain-containing protein [Paludibacteraceae bacterium]|nr:phage antirepressor N-terminal domain-containing protein [Paludibacteraceae bacterium]